MSTIDLIAVVAVCLTTITCFVIRASHGTDVEELAEDVSVLETNGEELTREMTSLKGVVSENAKALAAFRAEVKTSLSMGRK